MPYRYSTEFRRRVLDLLAAGRSVASVAADLGELRPRSQRNDQCGRSIVAPSSTAAQA
jgi:transposase-like protein